MISPSTCGWGLLCTDLCHGLLFLLIFITLPTGGRAKQKGFACCCPDLYYFRYVHNYWIHGDLDYLWQLAARRWKRICERWPDSAWQLKDFEKKQKEEEITGRYKSVTTHALWQHNCQGRIWTKGYDKRFCFTERELTQKIWYVNKHNLD